MDPATVFQDNQSTLSLLTNGRSTNKATRLIHIRYFYLKNKVEAGELVLEYKPTEDMLADIMTKPLQGEKLLNMRDELLNW
jgi:hypothetical protein